MKPHDFNFFQFLDLNDPQIEMKKQLITAQMTVHTLQEAVYAVQMLEQSNDELHEFINELPITQDIVSGLAAKFGGYCETIAQLLGTEGAKQYVQIQAQFLQKWATIFDPANHNDLTDSDKVEKVMALINNGADLGFSNAQGLTPLYAIMMPFIDAEMLSQEQQVAYAKIITQVVPLLMQYGAKHRIVHPVHKKNLLSITVKISAWANNTDLVKMLLDAEPSLNDDAQDASVSTK